MWGYVIDGEEKFTYTHLSSNPKRLGKKILDHLRTVEIDELRGEAKAIRLVTDETPSTLEDIERLKEWDWSASAGGPKDWYSLLRHTQGDPAATLRAGVMRDSGHFALNSLYCQWAYVIDLDAGTLEVYTGFQEKPHNRGRFACRGGEDRGYYPVALVATWSLYDLPDDEQFLKATEDGDVEEEAA